MSILLVNWAMTVGTLYITLVVLVRKERINDAVLGLPITVVVTIHTIRALFVGAPPFGIFLGAIMCNDVVKFLPMITFPFSDVAGFFLQIILVALCSLAPLHAVAKPAGSQRLLSHDSEKQRNISSQSVPFRLVCVRQIHVS